jgi:hypothetical protein
VAAPRPQSGDGLLDQVFCDGSVVTSESCRTDPPKPTRYLDALGEERQYRPFIGTVIGDKEKCLPPAEIDAGDRVRDVQAQEFG